MNINTIKKFWNQYKGHIIGIGIGLIIFVVVVIIAEKFNL